MTNQEAIKILREILTEAIEFENSVCYVTEEDREPLEMAIKALESQKTGHWVGWNETVERFDFTFGSWTEEISHCKCSECDKEVIVEETEVLIIARFVVQILRRINNDSKRTYNKIA